MKYPNNWLTISYVIFIVITNKPKLYKGLTNVYKYDFGVGTPTHRPKYRLWLKEKRGYAKTLTQPPQNSIIHYPCVCPQATPIIFYQSTPNKLIRL